MHSPHFASTKIVLLSALFASGLTIPSGPAEAQQPNGPMFYDQRRLPDMEVERRNQEVLNEQRRIKDERQQQFEASVRKKADDARQAEAQEKATEEKRLAAEADAKRRADDEKRLAAEADAKRRADDEKRLAAEADTKRRADDEKRLAAEADAKRRADEEKRLAAEADAKHRADDEKRLAAEADAKRSTQPNQTAAIAPAIVPVPNLEASPNNRCGPAKILTSPLTGGRVQVAIESSCRKSQPITVAYGTTGTERKLGSNGQLSLVLDLFLGPKVPAKVMFSDGSTQTIETNDGTVTGVSKVALIWHGPVKLDLHALEGGGVFNKSGHRWSGAASSYEAAKAETAETGRGAGFLSTLDDGMHDGDHVEVYTFLHTPDQESGVVSMLVDYVSRGSKPAGEMCGSGALAEIPFEVVTLNNKGKVITESGVVPSAKCGDSLSDRARYLRDVVPDLRFRN